MINAKTDFGAVGDGVADDTAAINAASVAATASGGEKVFLPRGVYRITAPIVIDGVGTTLEGEGAGDKAAISGNGPLGPTTIMCEHTAGAGIWVKQRNVTIRGIRIDSVANREVATFSVNNSGVRVEASDTLGARVSGTTLDDVYCVGHPGDGILLAGEVTNSRLVMSGATGCQGHGIAIDGGDRTGRTNKSRPGHVDIDMCRVSRCYGNGLVIGSPNADVVGLATLPYRITVNNLESFHLASDATRRYGKCAVWAFGENIEIKFSAFGGADVSGLARVNDGLYIAGRCIRLIGNRYMQDARAAVVGNRVNLPSRDIVFDGATASHDGAAMSPAVVITAGAKGVKIRAQQQSSEVTTWASGVAPVLVLDIIPD